MSCTAYGPISYTESKWVAAWLPIRYTLTSSKWPVNSFDGTDTITAITDNGGYARIAISSASVTYLAKETIKISGSLTTEYNGVWTIKTIHSTTDITISAPFTTTATGSFQRYYNNYHIKIRIHTGIPDGHTLASDRPTALRGTQPIRPNLNNVAVADISSFVRADISPIQNTLCALLQSGTIYGNDTNMWTSFYIAYAESYDLSNGTEVEAFTSSFVDDVADNGYSQRIFYASNSINQFQYLQGKSMGEYGIQDVVDEEFDAKFMTTFATPTYFSGNEYDVSVIIAYEDAEVSGFTIDYVLTEYDSFGAQTATNTVSLTYQGPGVYRFAFSEHTFNASTATFNFHLEKSTGDELTEIKTFKLDTATCGKNPVYLRWLNPIGGWEGWLFPADSDRGFDVSGKDVTRRDVYADWDSTFSRTGDTEDDYVRIDAAERLVIRSQFLSVDEKRAMRWLKASIKVYDVFLSDDSNCGNYRQRTVLLDAGEYNYRSDADKLKTVSFGMRYTDPVRVQGQ